MSKVTTLAEAIATARYHMTEVEPKVVADHARQGKVIVRRADGGHSVYQADAWKPKTGGMLSWSTPVGVIVATVALDLSVNMVRA